MLSDIVGLRARRLKLFGHMALADKSQDHSRARTACIWHSPKNWKRRLGRPRHTWLRTVEADLRPFNPAVLHQGSRRHRTELPGAHSRERLRHRQAPNDDDDESISTSNKQYCSARPTTSANQSGYTANSSTKRTNRKAVSCNTEHTKILFNKIMQ